MEWEAEELYKLSKIQPEILEVALKELWQRKPALYKSVIINAYLDEKIKLKEEYDEWLRKISREVRISPEELAYMSIKKFITEYRTRKAVKAYVEGEISLGKAAEVAGLTKRKFMAMIEDFGIPLNLDARDFIQSFRFLSELRGFRVYKDI